MKKMTDNQPGLPMSISLLTRIYLFAAIVLVVLGGITEAKAGDEVDTRAVETEEAEDPREANGRAGMFATEVWLTPLVLLPGVALLIVSTSARFGQLHNEFHRLLDHPDAHAKILAQHLMRRCALFRDSLVALYTSVGMFAFGSLLGSKSRASCWELAGRRRPSLGSPKTLV